MSLKKPEDWRVMWAGPSQASILMESDCWKQRGLAQSRETGEQADTGGHPGSF